MNVSSLAGTPKTNRQVVHLQQTRFFFPMIFLLGEEAIPKRIGYTGSWPKTGTIHGLVNGVVPNEAVRRVAMIPSQKEKTPWKLIIISMFSYSKTDSAAASISLRTRKPISGGRSEPPIAVEGKAFSSQQRRNDWSS